MNATHNEVLVQCTKCGTRCAPWLAHCRKCGAPMAGQHTSPDWTDGQSNREMLDSLDAMGGAGVDLADQEVFKLLDEIENLSKAKARAAELLEGTGKSTAPVEPRLGASAPAQQNTFIASQLAELSDKASNFSDKPGNDLSDKPLGQPAVQAALPERKEPATPDTAASFGPKTGPANRLPGIGASLAEQSAATVQTPAVDAVDMEPAAAQQMVESREIDAPERNFELGVKRKPAPEDFLAPDFFDPRDRKPKPKRGLWTLLAVIIIVMLLVAAYLIKKNYVENRPKPAQDYGDLSKPFGK